MTTHSPAYYRDVIRLCHLVESPDHIPQWFRSAWQADQVELKPGGAFGHVYVASTCSYPIIHHPYIEMLKINFIILHTAVVPADSLSITCKIVTEDHLTYGIDRDKYATYWQQGHMKSDLTSMLEDITKVSCHIWQVISFIPSQGLWNVGCSQDFRTTLINQIQPVAQVLWEWGRDS